MRRPLACWSLVAGLLLAALPATPVSGAPGARGESAWRTAEVTQPAPTSTPSLRLDASAAGPDATEKSQAVIAPSDSVPRTGVAFRDPMPASRVGLRAPLVHPQRGPPSIPS